MNVHITPRTIYLTRHGESMYNVTNRWFILCDSFGIWHLVKAYWLFLHIILSNSWNICPIHVIFVQFMEYSSNSWNYLSNSWNYLSNLWNYLSNSWHNCPIHGIFVQFMEYLSNSLNICPIHGIFVQFIEYLSNSWNYLI